MFFKWIKAIVILPLNALVFIPALIVWISGDRLSLTSGWKFHMGILLLAAGFALAVWTMTLFHRLGKGTAAPWDPPQQLVVAGPYCHVRNPMLTSVFLMLAAEALLAGSVVLLSWLAVFVCVNMLYFPLVEEKELLRRFGADYARYKANVPRYLPRLKPWRYVPPRGGKPPRRKAAASR
ncbi:MAG: isoprenylcysteine carboxylmethyltransferase family protein [Kiritimatiellaeota bacterium]|nr:isoprenylcysteine carboxylmethyltransferase family protein [Kiritimatiellota bacterium]